MPFSIPGPDLPFVSTDVNDIIFLGKKIFSAYFKLFQFLYCLFLYWNNAYFAEILKSAEENKKLKLNL